MGIGREGDNQGREERDHRVAKTEAEIQAKVGAGKQAPDTKASPPKDKPIVLILGGALDPMHIG